MEFEWSESEARFRQELRAFIDAALPPHWLTLIPGEDPASEFTMEFCRRLAERGYLVPHWPARYGGRDASPWEFVVLGEELWRVGEPRGAQYMNVNWIGPAIMMAGTEEQKDLHLNRIARGDVLWCQGFSEPGSGTDLGSLRTRAERVGDNYVVNGEKVWVSYARHAEFCILLARTDQRQRGNKGISIFLVPTDTPGFQIDPIPSVLDVHEFCRLEFENMTIPASALLGEEHKGWPVVLHALAHERIAGPRHARAAFVLERMADHLQRVAPDLYERFEERISAARADCSAARVLTYAAVNERNHHRPEIREVSVARVAIVRAEREVAELGLDIFGDDGVHLGSVGNSQLKTAMIAGLGAGSVELQLNMVARYLFRNHEEDGDGSRSVARSVASH